MSTYSKLCCIRITIQTQ